MSFDCTFESFLGVATNTVTDLHKISCVESMFVLVRLCWLWLCPPGVAPNKEDPVPCYGHVDFRH